MAGDVAELRREYDARRRAIRARLRDFARLGRTATEEELFAELAFCLLTPQTSAQACDAAVRELVRTRLLYRGEETAIARVLHHRVRFHNHKAAYLVAARRVFTVGGRIGLRGRLAGFRRPAEARESLVAVVPGLGYKEASHFLRNIGRGGDLAILDRHILRNLESLGVTTLPRTLTPRRYRELEEDLRRFSRKVGIPLAELDLLLWSRETGEVFK